MPQYDEDRVMSTKRYHRDLVDAVAAIGAVDPRVVCGQKHPRLIFTIDGKTIKLPIAGSPGCWRSLANTVAQVKRMIGADGMNREWYYFGCIGSSGHRLYRANGTTVWINWYLQFDGALAPKTDKTGQRALFHRLTSGIVALSWWDYSGDSRGGSNSTIFAPADQVESPEAMLTQARLLFPAVFARQSEVVIVGETT